MRPALRSAGPREPRLCPAARRPARALLTPPRAPGAPEEQRAPSSSRPAPLHAPHPGTRFSSSPLADQNALLRRPRPLTSGPARRTLCLGPALTSGSLCLRRPSPAVGNFRLRARPASPQGWPRPHGPGWAGPRRSRLRRQWSLPVARWDWLGPAAAASKTISPSGVSVGVVSGV